MQRPVKFQTKGIGQPSSPHRNVTTTLTPRQTHSPAITLSIPTYSRNVTPLIIPIDTPAINTSNPPQLHPPAPSTQTFLAPKVIPQSQNAIKPFITTPMNSEWNWSIASEHFQTLIDLSEKLNKWGGSRQYPKFLDELFMEKVPEEIRNKIYFQTFLLVDELQHPEHLRPRIGEWVFRGNVEAQNECRSIAIRQYLLHTLACDFASVPGNTLPQELLDRFNRFAEADKQKFATQLGHIHAQVKLEDTSVTNRERGEALLRAVQKRAGEYTQRLTRQYVDALEIEYTNNIKKLQERVRELERSRA
jgi:hypothetical protein